MSMQRTEMIRTPLVLPKHLIETIDKVMGLRKRSKFVTQAATRELRRIQLQRSLEKAAGAWKDKDHPELKKKGTHQWIRDFRKEADKRFSQMEK